MQGLNWMKHRKNRICSFYNDSPAKGPGMQETGVLPGLLAQVFHPCPYPSMIPLHVGHIGFPIRDPL